MNAFVKDHDAAARTVMLIPGVRGIEVFSRGLEIFWRIILNGEASQEQVMSEVNAATPRLPGRVVYEVRAAARF
jgi:hypothetical protein